MLIKPAAVRFLQQATCTLRGPYEWQTCVKEDNHLGGYQDVFSMTEKAALTAL